MKQSIKRNKKKATGNAANTRPHTTKQTGYKEEVFNKEEQETYNKSDQAADKVPNTAGPED